VGCQWWPEIDSNLRDAPAMRDAQSAAAGLIADVLAGRSVSESDLASANAGPAARDLTFGTLRRLGTQRAIAARLARRGIPDPWVEALLCVALYQLQHTRAAPHAIVDEAVRATRMGGHSHAAAFINASLRRFQRESTPLLEAAAKTPEGRWNHPRWWVERLQRDHGEYASHILDSGVGHPPMGLRVNQRHSTVEDYLARLRSEGIDASRLENDALVLDKPRASRELPGFGSGDVSIQDAGAQWAARILDAQHGMRVLDACAGPGGKAAHLLETADIELTCLDSAQDRLAAVQGQMTRLGLAASLRCARAEDLGAWWDGRPFGRILLDAPCSGSGIVRRHPDAKWLRRAADIPSFARQQKTLLSALWQALAPGGKLLYVTCSVFAEENVDVVRDWLGKASDAAELPITAFSGRDGVLLPSSVHDGFFYALFVKLPAPAAPAP